MSILFLTEDDVKKSMDIASAVALAEKGILADGAGEVAGDKFYISVADNGFIKPFSGYMAGEEFAYVKTFSFFEGNPAKGLPVTDSQVILFDAKNGLPVCFMEAAWITAVKTGASTAITAKYLAPENSKIATIIGAGGLGRMHMLAYNEVFDLEEVRVVDVNPETAKAFAADLSKQTGVRIVALSDCEEAVRGADIVTTVTTGAAINVRHEWLKPGAFVARMGSYQEVDFDVVLKADKLVVDRWAYVSYRVPEMIDLIASGDLTREHIHAEWPDIAGKHAAGRERDDEIIVYIALGIWGEYAAILPEVYRRAKKSGLGTLLSK